MNNTRRSLLEIFNNIQKINNEKPTRDQLDEVLETLNNQDIKYGTLTDKYEIIDHIRVIIGLHLNQTPNHISYEKIANHIYKDIILRLENE